MIDKFDYNLAARILIIAPGILVIFHICNLFGLVPGNIVWTGRISSSKTMLLFGLVSIALNFTYMWFGAVRGNYIQNLFSDSLANKLYPFLFWWLVGNSVANVFSKSNFEVIAFTPILILLTICCYRVRNSSDDIRH